MLTNVSIWEKQTYFAPRDIIIIGSGFVGLWTALELIKKFPSIQILIIDKGIIPTGASTKNAGFACFGSLSELMYDYNMLGEDAMLSIVEKRFKGIQKIQTHFNHHVIDYKNWGGYELFTANQYTKNALHRDLECMNAILKKNILKKNIFQLNNEKIAYFNFRKIKNVVFNWFEGQLHSAKLLESLTQEVVSKGVKIMQQIEVKKIHNSTGEILLECKQGLSFKTNKLIVCTNAFTKKLIPSIDVVPARGQVLLTEKIPNLKLKGTFHFDEGFYYFRNFENRILLGGARNIDFASEQTHNFNTSETIQKALEEFLYNIVLPPQIKPTIEMRWSGIMAMGSEKIPILKKLHNNIILAVRMNGMGVAIAPIIAEEITAMI